MIRRRAPLQAGLGLGTLALLCACQSAPVPASDAVTLASIDLPAPLTVAVPVSENSAEGLTVNDWGGEIPQGKPASGVDEDGLADLR